MRLKVPCAIRQVLCDGNFVIKHTKPIAQDGSTRVKRIRPGQLRSNAQDSVNGSQTNFQSHKIFKDKGNTVFSHKISGVKPSNPSLCDSIRRRVKFTRRLRSSSPARPADSGDCLGFQNNLSLSELRALIRF